MPWAAAAGSGIALALALPGLQLWPLVLLFPGLMLFSLKTCNHPVRGFLLGWIAGISHWLVSTSWVISVMHDFGGLNLGIAILCLFVMAAILGLSWALPASLTMLARPSLRPFFFPAAWIFVEACRQFPPLLFPWNTVASAFTSHPQFLSTLPIWGASGLGWATIALGASLFGLLAPTTRRIAIAQIVIITLLMVIFTFISPAPQPTSQSIWVALVQPGTTLSERWRPSMWREVTDRVWRLSREATGADLVLWSEGSVPYVLDNDPMYRAQVENLATELQTTIVLNSVATLAKGDSRNSAYLVTKDGVSSTRYDKVRLVPFGEYVPAWARMAFTEALVREVASFTPGEKPILMPGPIPLGIAICYEIIFADHIAHAVRDGAEIIATITNDGWYGFSWAPEQHFSQAVLRAAETRRWVIRAALTGISGTIDPYGQVHDVLEVGASGIVLANVSAMSGLTPRVRFGDWWALVLAVLIITLIIENQWRVRMSHLDSAID